MLGLFVFYLGTKRPPTKVENPPEVVVTPAEAPREVELVLYFAGEDGFVVERRRVELGPFEVQVERAVAELARGPEVVGARPLLPEGLPPPQVYVAGKTVYVDLPSAYRELNLGVRGESLLLYGLANTALANSDADEVRFLLGGKPAMALIHLSLADPFRRPR